MGSGKGSFNMALQRESQEEKNEPLAAKHSDAIQPAELTQSPVARIAWICRPRAALGAAPFSAGAGFAAGGRRTAVGRQGFKAMGLG